MNFPNFRPTVKYTQKGEVKVEAQLYNEPQGLRDPNQIVIEVSISDTGCGIEARRLESIFRELEQVDHSNKGDGEPSAPGLGLGLAVVAHAISQMNGQLRVDSKPAQGSKFVCLIPFDLTRKGSSYSSNSSRLTHSYSGDSLEEGRSRRAQEEINSLVEAIGSSSVSASVSPAGVWNSAELVITDSRTDPTSAKAMARSAPAEDRPVTAGEVELNDSNFPLRSVRVDSMDLNRPASVTLSKTSEKGSPEDPIPVESVQATPNNSVTLSQKETPSPRYKRPKVVQPSFSTPTPQFNCLIVEVSRLTDSYGSSDE